VEDYQRQFLQLLCRCDGLSPTHQMNLFTTGLGEPMTSDVEMQQPADLQAAMSLAWAFERRATAVATPPTRTHQRIGHPVCCGLCREHFFSGAVGSVEIY
jgi:hypothetical protein